MKLIKFSIVALILTVSAQFAKAQVQVGIGVNIGRPTRTIVVGDDYPVYRSYPRTVYYERPVYRRYPRRAYYRPAYYGRAQYRQVMYRGHGRGNAWGHGNGRGHGRRW